jgi:hypothetical protein
VVGANDIAFNFSADRETYVFGYPSNYKNGEVLHYCHGRSRMSDPSEVPGIYIKCSLSRGASGGPWLTDFDVVGGHGLLYSVTSTVDEYDEPTEIRGISFDDSVRDYYNQTVGVGKDVVTPGTIAYSSDAGGDGEIYSMDSDGNNKRQHTNNDKDDKQPAVPRDGGSLAYSSYDGNDYEIRMFTSRGVNLQLTNNNTNDFEPSFSPDGKKIVYEGIDPTGGDSEIYTINATTGQTPVNVTNNNREDHDPDYGPNGTSIAYRACEGEGDACERTVDRADYEIYTIGGAGGTPVQITKNETHDWNPDYEPEDGTHIAYQGRQQERAEADYEIHVVRTRVEGKRFYTPRQVTYNDRLDADPSWAPSGSPSGFDFLPSHIVYTAHDGNDFEIYRINRSYGHVLKLTRNSAPEVTHDINPSWGRPPHPPVPSAPRPPIIPWPPPVCPPPPGHCP